MTSHSTLRFVATVDLVVASTGAAPGGRASRNESLECLMPDEKITATEARQATMRPRAMVLVLFASLFLCLMAGLGLALGWFSLPSLPQQ
jgi:hypothetical protein